MKKNPRPTASYKTEQIHTPKNIQNTHDFTTKNLIPHKSVVLTPPKIPLVHVSSFPIHNFFYDNVTYPQWSTVINTNATLLKIVSSIIETNKSREEFKHTLEMDQKEWRAEIQSNVAGENSKANEAPKQQATEKDIIKTDKSQEDFFIYTPEIDQKEWSAEIQPNAVGANPKANESPKQQANEQTTKMFTSTRALQDEVFKLGKEHIQHSRLFLVAYNIFEGTLKKTSMPLFEVFYAMVADKDGIPEEKVKSILNLAMWVVIGIIAFALYECIMKELNEIKTLDAQAVTNYSEAEKLYNQAILIAQECVRQLNSISELEEKKKRNENLLTLLKECTDIERSPSIIGAALNNLSAVIDSIVNNKPLKKAQLDCKIEQELQIREETDPLASELLELKGAKGFKGTENILQCQIEETNQQIGHKKVGLKLKVKELRFKESQIHEINNNTEEKLEKQIQGKLFVKMGLFAPNYLHYLAVKEQNNSLENKLNNKKSNKNDSEEDNSLRIVR
ncbi:hypothetical protein Lsan_2451 [Legionella santicrucis]|uniref:Uncharacterized protein n=1 Tax=Legionella santicrucis TaxID=45074 RepID=A0A0W0YQC0_9GAMM|nr:hypothetical protein [Legionella santicrucis]KTD59100.1 hypothetical protein Lsan_2451 [Legionella santicrucis]